MSGLAAAAALVGGVGLFLLGTRLMTEGLKLAAGPALAGILAGSTRTRVRGLFSGFLMTAFVQSSSAVTVAAIGFVNAGLLTLMQSMWVLFGANVGSTVTGWLVALVGVQFQIEAFALPLVGLGMALRITGEGSRRGALGMAIAGLGVLFLGIDLLKDAFSGLATDVSLPQGTGLFVILAQLVIGVLLTVLMQSSGAALAVALTAAQGGLITLPGAAAVAIGANIGTSIKALLAAIGATPNAKRAAAAHVLFNVLTGVVALALLPVLVPAIGAAWSALGLASSPAAELALFHTTFNLLGVLLMWPLAGRLERELQKRFRTEEETEARPQYLDDNVLAVPSLAIDALVQEVRRSGTLALRLARGALLSEGPPPLREQRMVEQLNLDIAEFITRLSRGSMADETARRLPQILRAVRYYDTVAELVAEAEAARAEARAARAGRPGPGSEPGPAADRKLSEQEETFRHKAASFLERVSPERILLDESDTDAALQEFETGYQQLKAAYLTAGTKGRLALGEMDARLRYASAMRRVCDQALKAERLLRSMGRAPA